MRIRCERCEIAVSLDDPAPIASCADIFCESCGRTMDYVRPNYGGEPVAGPRRLK
ncbi:DUF1272 domain-containing protein [Nocardia aurantiaca]|uniref:DUF1272 domain-containing protein n=1 Tax=Nocardia aurantiaca TaxID=2675850 RepID=A0A6I3KV30_9NOCA|nr:DUF1272 domain-containing protein [Nocardia aurantiaca]